MIPRTPEAWRATTEGVIVLTAVTLCVYNVAARYFGGNDATISVVMNDAGHRWPIVPAAVALLVGHWFWPVK